MICPVCGGETRVIDSCNSDDEVYRRRKCVDCGNAFCTTEIESRTSRDRFRAVKILAEKESKQRKRERSERKKNNYVKSRL